VSLSIIGRCKNWQGRKNLNRSHLISIIPKEHNSDITLFTATQRDICIRRFSAVNGKAALYGLHRPYERQEIFGR